MTASDPFGIWFWLPLGAAHDAAKADRVARVLALDPRAPLATPSVPNHIFGDPSEPSKKLAATPRLSD